MPTLTLIGIVSTIAVGPRLPQARRRSRAPAMRRTATIAAVGQKMRRGDLTDL
jgi:hypothetical protein